MNDGEGRVSSVYKKHTRKSTARRTSFFSLFSNSVECMLRE